MEQNPHIFSSLAPQQLVNEHFPDRSTKASEARENQHKNRYPDIKAYDQTRVKLTPVDGVPGSDYINANFVLGYKELKKFICAQGKCATIDY
jgi:Protein tyrosine phosphatase